MSTTHPLIAIALGSNLGDREARLVTAVSSLSGILTQISVGGLYESSAVGPGDQPPYLNSALVGIAHLPPEPLLAVLKFLERQAGRGPGERWGPRPLDLDLLLYGDLARTAPELTLPHPRLRQRPFVLAPLADVAPDLAIPPDGLTPLQLLTHLDRANLARRDWSEPTAPSAGTDSACYPPRRP